MSNMQNELTIQWLETVAGVTLNEFQREVISELYNTDRRRFIMSPARQSGKTFICRLLVERCPEISIFLPSNSLRESYPLELYDRIHVYTDESSWRGRIFDTIIFDECPHNIEVNDFLSRTGAQKAIALISSNWWDHRPGFNEPSFNGMRMDFQYFDEVKEKDPDWDGDSNE